MKELRPRRGQATCKALYPLSERVRALMRSPNPHLCIRLVSTIDIGKKVLEKSFLYKEINARRDPDVKHQYHLFGFNAESQPPQLGSTKTPTELKKKKT